MTDVADAAWLPGAEQPAFDAAGLVAATGRIRESAQIVRDAVTGLLGVAFGGQMGHDPDAPAWVGSLPPLFPEWLGDRGFTETHGLRFPYAAGEMANGIATPTMVVAMAQAGMLGFFGAAGLSLDEVESGLDEIDAALAQTDLPFGSNLIHSPGDPDLENDLAALYLRRGIRRIGVSAFMALTPAVIRCAATGLTENAQGQIVRRHHLFAKISRPEVAAAFMEPAPEAMLDDLLRQGQLTPDEAALARRIPVACDLTVESDSGGHTDNRPLGALFPVIAALRDELSRRYDESVVIRLGAAGGLGTPQAVASAFALGAAYVMTGTVNQACVESGLSDEGRRMLAEAGVADVIMAPAADMFEMGVKVQVLKRGSMFGPRALRLYDLYRSHDSLDALPPLLKARLERDVLGATVDDVWTQVDQFFAKRDPRELDRAAEDPKHHMALVFRWYLGLSSRWAINGDPARKLDYQIWCGPAMGAFNDWTRGSFLAEPANRTVVQVALNLLEGAAVITRAQQLRTLGVAIPAQGFCFAPRPLG